MARRLQEYTRHVFYVHNIPRRSKIVHSIVLLTGVLTPARDGYKIYPFYICATSALRGGRLVKHIA